MSTFSLASTVSPSDWQSALNNLSHKIIAPSYAQFANSAAKLHTTTETLCHSANQASLTATQQAFTKNVKDWQTVQWLNFGPATLFMRYYSFAYWPDKKGLTQRQLRRLVKDKADIDSEEFWRNASIAVRGLTAMEAILYRPDLDPIANPDYCSLLTNISQYHAQSIHDIHTEWVNGQFQDWVFLDEDESGSLATAAFEQLVQKWLEHLSMVKETKLEQPLGWQQKSNIKLAEFFRSGQTLSSIQRNVQVYHDIYHAGTPSLYSIALQHNPTQAKQLEDSLKSNITEAAQLPTNLFTDELTAKQRKEQVRKLVLSLSKTQKQLTILVTDLGFRIGFNSRDGD
ncbi:peptidase M75, Imelysin [Marinomonas agarivorans]|nr:peptidase M75, Imelysin [Marinomonas agarivorans]